jgi:glycerol uptake facilitator-like aquaporin
VGIPTPEPALVQTAFIMETIAIVVIHIVRISLMIDNRGKKDSNGFALGAIYTAMVLSCAPISGACFNPARSFGPLFVMNEVGSNGQFIMSFAPFVGCTIGMALYKKFLISEELEDELEEL